MQQFNFFYNYLIKNYPITEWHTLAFNFAMESDSRN